VVEDNAINQQVAEELLTGQGAIVSIASDGRQGVNAIASAKEQYDIVMMDVQMPVMDGYEATRTIRNKLGLERLPIVGLTANAMASDRERCLQAGMNDHLAKPFDLTQLVSMILRLVGGLFNGDAIATDTNLVIGTTPITERNAVEKDIADAIAKLGGMVPVYKRAATTFVNQLPELRSGLFGAIEASNMDQALGLLHTYKGAAATIGLTALKNFLGEMESKLRAEKSLEDLRGQISGVKALEQYAQSEFKQTFEKFLHDQAQTTGDADLAGFDAAKIDTVLQQLKTYLDAEDYAGLSYFAESRDVLMHLPEATYQRLEASIQDLDFEEAIAVCRAAQYANMDHF
jgi:CheY-like chemotaxis protein